MHLYAIFELVCPTGESGRMASCPSPPSGDDKNPSPRAKVVKEYHDEIALTQSSGYRTKRVDGTLI